MNKKEFNDLLSIEFKIPSAQDLKKNIKYNPLSPKDFLEFIEAGLKLTPDFDSYRKARLKEAPCSVRFKL